MRNQSKTQCECRLTVIGARRDVQRFQNRAWENILRARYCDPLQLSPGRFVCQFTTESHDLRRLQRLSRSQPGLVLLLDFEFGRIKGLAKAKAGELEHCEISY